MAIEVILTVKQEFPIDTIIIGKRTQGVPTITKKIILTSLTAKNQYVTEGVQRAYFA